MYNYAEQSCPDSPQTFENDHQLEGYCDYSYSECILEIEICDSIFGRWITHHPDYFKIEVYHKRQLEKSTLLNIASDSGHVSTTIYGINLRNDLNAIQVHVTPIHRCGEAEAEHKCTQVSRIHCTIRGTNIIIILLHAIHAQ